MTPTLTQLIILAACGLALFSLGAIAGALLGAACANASWMDERSRMSADGYIAPEDNPL